MRTVKEILKCLLLAALIIAVCTGIRLEMAFSTTIVNLPIVLDSRIANIEGDVNERLDLMNTSVASAIDRTDRRSGQAIEIANRLSVQLPALADHHAEATEKIIDKHLGIIDASLKETSDSFTDLSTRYQGFATQVDEELTEFTATTKNAVRPIQESAQQVDDALPLFLNCEFNEDCLFNRYQGVSKSLEKVGASSEGIAKDIKREADQLTKPPGFWAGFRMWMITVARFGGAVY